MVRDLRFRSPVLKGANADSGRVEKIISCMEERKDTNFAEWRKLGQGSLRRKFNLTRESPPPVYLPDA